MTHPVATPLPPRPANLDRMMDMARELGRDTDMVRVDLYDVDGQVYFGELTPYHVPVPSFGEWGFVLAANKGNVLRAGGRLVGGDAGAKKFLEAGLLPTLFTFPSDMTDPGDVGVNRLDRPILLQYFLEDWSDWQRETVQ